MKFKTAKQLSTLFYGLAIALVVVIATFEGAEQVKKYLYIALGVFMVIGFIINFNWGKCPYCGRVIKVNMMGNLYTQTCMYCKEKPFIDPEKKAEMEAKKNAKNAKK